MSAGHGTKADPDAHGRKADIMDIATLAQNVTALHRCAEQCDAADARVAELKGRSLWVKALERAVRGVVNAAWGKKPVCHVHIVEV